MAGESACLIYEGTRNAYGYGVLPQAVYGSRLAHRAALAAKLGRPVQGHALHSCDNPPCINPEHLREGTQADNISDAINRGRARGRYTYVTECVYGHPFTPKNTTIKRYRDGRTERVCLTCRRRRNQEQAARRKAARKAGTHGG